MAANQPHNPLGQDQLEKLNQVLAMIPETELLIKKTINSGIPAEQAKAENDQQRDLALALKRNFFPGEK